MTSNEAIRRWQAESLAKRLLEDDDVPSIIATAFDLRCQLEFEEAVLTLAAAKERAIGRTCADGFADFSIQVDAALGNSSKVDKAKQSLVITEERVSLGLKTRQKVLDQLNEAESKLEETRQQRMEIETALRWLETKRSLDDLIKNKQFEDASRIRIGFIEELRHYPASDFGQKLRHEVERINILGLAEQEMDVWMTGALDKCRELGFALLSTSYDSFEQPISATKLDVSARGFDIGPVRRFFSVARRDYAEERYAKHRLPALRQTLASLSRATTTIDSEERIVRFRNVLSEICGFFVIEKNVGALAHGELKETWVECLGNLVKALDAGFPDESQAEAAAVLACDFARTCAVIDMDYSPIQRFFVSKMDIIRKGWMGRCYGAIKDFCQSEMNKSAFAKHRQHPDDSHGQNDDLLPFTIKTLQEISRSVLDAKLLDRFASGQFGSTLSSASTPRAFVEMAVVEVVLQEHLDRPECDLSDALFIFRASRELRSNCEGPSAYFETETRSREKIHELFVAAKVDKMIVFQNPQDYLPPLSSTTKFEPHECVLQALQEIENAFASQEAASIPRELKASLQQETLGRLAERMEYVIFKDAAMINPVALKRFSLDILAIDQAFPDHFERFSPLLNVLLPFSTENGLETAIMDATNIDRERLLSLLLRFREMDASSRLFAPPAVKRQILDMRDTEAKKYLNMLQSSQ